MTAAQFIALISAAIGALAASAIFLIGAWYLLRPVHFRNFIAHAYDLLIGSWYPLKLGRAAHNPVLPTTRHAWEAAGVLNPAAIDDGERIHLFYRAIGTDGVSRVGYASSRDGIHFDERLPHPVFATQKDPRDSSRLYARNDARFAALAASGGSWSGVEDPRTVLIDDRMYLTYNSFQDWSMRIGMSTLSAEDLQNRRWKWTPPAYLSPPGQIHKNWLLFPRKINGKFAVLHSVSPTPDVEYVEDIEAVGVTEPHIRSVESPRTAGVKDGWETRVRGAGPPPIETKDGWLVLYHAHDHDHGRYKLGAMLLDLDDPTKVLARSPMPVLEPDARYENEGAKPGIVYACGAVVRDGMLMVYYGGADNFVCMAAAPLDDFLEKLKAGHAAKLAQQRAPIFPNLPVAFAPI